MGNRSSTYSNSRTQNATGEPGTNKYSQFSTTVVPSSDPYQLTQNPLDPFQANIFSILTTFKGRNANLDLRGQPDLPADYLDGQDQLVNPSSLARLTEYGPSRQISGILAPKRPSGPMMGDV